MAKKLDTPPGEAVGTEAPVPTLTIRDDRTGRSVVVRGAGALAKSDLKLREGISLLRPIAEQALTRTGRRKVG